MVKRTPITPARPNLINDELKRPNQLGKKRLEKEQNQQSIKKKKKNRN